MGNKHYKPYRINPVTPLINFKNRKLTMLYPFPLFIGLSFDLTGSYIASLHIGAGLWLICALLTTALYISYSQSRLRNQYTIPDSDISEDSCDVKHIPVHDLNEGYILLGNDDVQKTANMRVVVTTAVSSEQKGHDIISKGYVNMSCAYIKTDKKVGVTFGDPWVEKVSVV